MDYLLKKGLGGKLRIHYACPACSVSLNSPFHEAGKSETCPSCSAGFSVPGTAEREAAEARKAKEEARRAQEAERKAQEWHEEEARKAEQLEAALQAVTLPAEFPDAPQHITVEADLRKLLQNPLLKKPVSTIASGVLLGLVVFSLVVGILYYLSTLDSDSAVALLILILIAIGMVAILVFIFKLARR